MDDPETVQSAKLVIGIHRSGGITESVAVSMNDTPITVDTGDASEFSEFFAPLDAAVPTSILRGNNNLTITAQKGVTITSIQIATHRTID